MAYITLKVCSKHMVSTRVITSYGMYKNTSESH